MRRFPLSPIHRSTLVLAVLVFVLGIGANFGGDYHPPDFGEFTARVSFGWPWAYGDWEGNFSGIKLSPWTFWRVDLVSVWYPFAFVGNLLALLLIVWVIAAIWEWRRRKVKHLWQFTLADIFLGSLVVMAFYGVERWLCRDVFAEREFRLTLDNPWMFDGPSTSLGIAEGSFPNHQDVPADWFWELFSIPETHRPYRRLALYFVGPSVQSPPTMTARQLELLGRCRGLRAFRCYEFTLPDLHVLKSWPQLRSFGIAHVNDAQMNSMPSLPFLEEVAFYDGPVTDDGLRALQRQRSLTSLTLLDLPNVNGSGLSSLTTLTELDLDGIKLNENGMVAVSTLPELWSLRLNILVDDKYPRTLNWIPLGQARQLRVLSINEYFLNNPAQVPYSQELDDQGLATIATLPNLHSLRVASDMLTDEGVRSLAAANRLNSLTIFSSNGCLTDATLDFFSEQKRPRNLTLVIPDISDEAIQRLRRAHPHASVRR